MTADPSVYTKLFGFATALSMLGMAWWRKDGPKEDEMIVEAADTVLDALADADTVAQIKDATGHNVRDQITVGEAIDLHAERVERGFWRRN